MSLRSKKLLLTAVLVLMTAILGNGCATTLYICAQCSGNARNIRQTNVRLWGNILYGDSELMRDILEGPDDYLLPPWLDRSLNVCILCLDFPISFVFDIITFPYQYWRYYHLPPPSEEEKLEEIEKKQRGGRDEY